MKSGVWTALRSTWRIHGVINLPPCMSHLTQIRFMGDTCRMFPSHDLITKQSNALSSQQHHCLEIHRIESGLCLISLWYCDPDPLQRWGTFLQLHLLKEMSILSIISASVAEVFPFLYIWDACMTFHLITWCTDQSATEPCLKQWKTIRHFPSCL